jgi:hypothetical protein
MPSTLLIRMSALVLAAAALTLPARADNGFLERDRFAVGVNYTGITYHPGGGENEEPYKRALDDGDYWVLLVGFQANADYKLHRFFYLRTATSFYKDCSDLWAGFYHFGFRANWDATERLSMRIGVGPTLLWRENWYGKVKGYTRTAFSGRRPAGNTRARSSGTAETPKSNGRRRKSFPWCTP